MDTELQENHQRDYAESDMKAKCSETWDPQTLRKLEEKKDTAKVRKGS